MKISQNSTKVHFKIEQYSSEGDLGLHQAYNDDGNPLSWDSNLKVFSEKPAVNKDGYYKEASITLYRDDIARDKGHFSFQDNKPLTNENAMVAVFAHEAEHDLNKHDIRSICMCSPNESNYRDVERCADIILKKVCKEIYYSR